MFAFLTKFKTEVRAFITDAHTRFDDLENKISVIYANIINKVETKVDEVKTTVEDKVKAAESTIVTNTVDATAAKVIEAVAPAQPATPPAATPPTE